MIYMIKNFYHTLEKTTLQTAKQRQKKRISRKNVFSLNIQLVKIQLTRDLKDYTKLCQGIRLPCKNDQGYCDPTKRNYANIVWLPVDTCTTFQFGKIHARIIKFHQKYFIESILFDRVNPDKKRQNNH